MPELPEVETTRRGIEPYVRGHRIDNVIVRDRRLRWPVTAGLAGKLQGQTIRQVHRRGKYLLIDLEHGTLIIHLGMSGHLAVVDIGQDPVKHDHVDIIFDNGQVLRYHDPRRFGAILWTTGDPLQHKLLAGIGPEPLSEDFNANYLLARMRGRHRNIRDTLLDSRIVAGVGNIYANEALFQAGIDPRRGAGRIGRDRIEKLVAEIKQVLASAITAGGTTLRDFRNSDGRPGYFKQELAVYGRGGENCRRCGGLVRQQAVGGRSLYFCSKCQK